ncbi:Hsp20/alpha crystallin family protein [Halosimplex litoreum]|uniref:Hsp20/alpha crystallin family protein n=1 Tax=Halosimplex litoreum TaxID=1198301 RepID=A0A7T3G0E4_9EURY|nr:Hsp20/alpha crystallin family protein [Halosimplex litoreum]QPV63956.1 Hsp20/alpha crystallin family protein [Halosimplex litoreum]
MNTLRDIGESLGNTVLENVGRAMGRAQERTPLPVDLLESDDAYLAVFDAPGAQSSDVQVQFDSGLVEVRIDRFRGFHEGFEMRYPGRGLALDGHVELPAEARVDADAATATLRENGTLEVRVPKAEPVDSEVDEALEADEVDEVHDETDADELDAEADASESEDEDADDEE